MQESILTPDQYKDHSKKIIHEMGSSLLLTLGKYFSYFFTKLFLSLFSWPSDIRVFNES